MNHVPIQASVIEYPELPSTVGTVGQESRAL
jgi:hypothetical protein